jgi:hypothetical protein
MEVSSQLRASTVTLIGWEVGWVPLPVCMFKEEKNFVSVSGIKLQLLLPVIFVEQRML